MSIVYYAKNKINGKGYVGVTGKGIDRRRYGHENEASKGSDLLFHRALRKYGFDNFDWKILMEEDGKDELFESEVACIKMLKTKSPYGYNMTDGGEGQIGMSEETRLKLRNFRLGKPLSLEHRMKISEGNRGKHPSTPIIRQMLMKRNTSLSNRIKVSNSHKENGIRPTLEAARKGGLALRGRKQSPELIAKRIAGLKGKSKSEEHRKRLSDALIGRKIGPFSEEHKRKISEAIKAFHERKRASNAK
jgi:group I intron endonuclease